MRLRAFACDSESANKMQAIENDAYMMPSRKPRKMVRDTRQFRVVLRVALPTRAFPPRVRESCVSAFQRVVAGFKAGGVRRLIAGERKDVLPRGARRRRWNPACKPARRGQNRVMVAYIKQIADDIIADPPRGNAKLILESLSVELDRLDPRDFLPAGRANLVRVKTSIKHLLFTSPPAQHGVTIVFIAGARKLANDARKILDLYGGENSRTVFRFFTFIQNSDLKNIIERDYRELSLILFPSGAWKSTVVMAGSILEAILHDCLTSDAAIKSKALAAKNAPKKDLTKGEWSLHDLIQVAVELKLLPSDRADAIDTILRDYRNFVHPMKEVRGAHPCTEAEALMAKGALDSVCNHLTLP